MQYPAYLRLIDSFGVLAIISASLYALFPAEMRPASHIDDLWGNLSSELLGIWLAVRLIDYLIKRHEGAIKGRVRVVRGMRYIERLFTNFHRYPHPHDLSDLLREFRWNRGRLAERSKYLKKDERADVERFYELSSEIISLLPEGAPRPGEIIVYDTERYDELFGNLTIARQKAEENILEETDEDSGL